MAQAAGLSFTLDPRSLDVGAAEEMATFGRLQMRVNDRCLTEGVAPHESNELLFGPYVSGYHLAEWLMWNWWRLLWESPPRGGLNREWAFSHCLSSIGEGYVWPNVVISSDGCRAVTVSSRTSDAAPGLYRYVGAPDWQIISTEQLRMGMRGLVRSVLQRLDNAQLADTNLHRLWRDVELASKDERTARLRRVEARLGLDPNEVDEAVIQASCAAAESLGANALEELAADPAADSPTTLPTMKTVGQSARECGFDAQPRDAAELRQRDGLPTWGSVAAWRVGIAAARSLREQEALDGEPIDNGRLSELFGTRKTALEQTATHAQTLSFLLTDRGRSRLVLRSKWEVGRRFALARLLGDHLLAAGEPLLPATGAHTYRQKVQRAFAAELLCPYHAVVDFLGADRSEDRCNEAATHFNVYSLAIATLLANNEGQEQASVAAHSPSSLAGIW